MPNFFVEVHQDLIYASRCPSWPVWPILKVKRATKRAYPSFWWFSCAIANYFLGDQDSDVKNAKFFCGRALRPCLYIRLELTAGPTHFEGKTSLEASIPIISTIFVCYSKPFFGWTGFRHQKSQFFCGRPSRPCICIRLTLTVYLTHFEGQTSPEASILLILMIFVCFFGWSGLRHQKCQIFLWTSVKTISMLPVGPHGSSDPFWRSNKPQNEHTPHFDDFRVL